MQANLQQYYKDIRKALCCSSKTKRIILRGLQADVEDYVETHPEATLCDIQSRFGDPEVYAHECIASMGNNEVYLAIKNKSFRNRVWLYTGIAVTLIVFILSIGIAISNSQTVGRYYSNEIHDAIIETN